MDAMAVRQQTTGDLLKQLERELSRRDARIRTLKRALEEAEDELDQTKGEPRDSHQQLQGAN